MPVQAWGFSIGWTHSHINEHPPVIPGSEVSGENAHVGDAYRKLFRAKEHDGGDSEGR